MKTTKAYSLALIALLGTLGCNRLDLQEEKVENQRTTYEEIGPFSAGSCGAPITLYGDKLKYGKFENGAKIKYFGPQYLVDKDGNQISPSFGDICPTGRQSEYVRGTLNGVEYLLTLDGKLVAMKDISKRPKIIGDGNEERFNQLESPPIDYKK